MMDIIARSTGRPDAVQPDVGKPGALPQALQDALTALSWQGMPARQPATGTAGEIALAGCVKGCCKQVVVILHARTSSVTAVLCDPVREAACDLDAILAPEITGCPYWLVAHSELYGQLQHYQLLEHLGALADSHIAQLVVALASDGESLGELGGRLPLGGPDDPRRTYLRMLHGQLEHLLGRAGPPQSDDCDNEY